MHMGVWQLTLRTRKFFLEQKLYSQLLCNAFKVMSVFWLYLFSVMSKGLCVCLVNLILWLDTAHTMNCKNIGQLDNSI